MTVEYSKKFQKQYAKLSARDQLRFIDRQRLWRGEPHNPRLRLHLLTAEYVGYYSINVTGDIRALYSERENDRVVFSFIGTHSQLYG